MNMTTELDKHRAQFFQVLGFVFLTPFGSFVLRFLDIDDPFPLTLKGLFVLAISFLTAYFGIIFLLKGDEYAGGGK